MIRFNLVLPETIDFIPEKARRLLETSCKRTPSPVFGADEILYKVKNHIGDFYIVEKDSQVIGIIYLIVIQGLYQKTVNIVSLAADNLKEWKDDFTLFINRIIHENHADSALAITRFGMKKIFPKWKPKAELLEYRIAH